LRTLHNPVTNPAFVSIIISKDETIDPQAQYPRVMCIGSGSTIPTKRLSAEEVSAIFAEKPSEPPQTDDYVKDPVSLHPPLHKTTAPEQVAPKTTGTKRTTKTKRVTFAADASRVCEDAEAEVRVDIVAVLTPASLMTDFERSSTYWQDNEADVFKNTAKMIAAEIRRRGGEDGGTYGQTLNCAYATCSSHTRNSDYPLGRDDLFFYLAHWCRVGHSRRGLERWNNVTHAYQRNAARQAASQAILQEQDRQKQKGLANDELLRRVSETYTRSARMFALAFGQADEAAVFCPPGSGMKKMTARPSLSMSTSSSRPRDRLKLTSSHAADAGAGGDVPTRNFASAALRV